VAYSITPALLSSKLLVCASIRFKYILSPLASRLIHPESSNFGHVKVFLIGTLKMIQFKEVLMRFPGGFLTYHLIISHSWHFPPVAGVTNGFKLLQALLSLA
jgi:hypothetical protein